MEESHSSAGSPSRGQVKASDFLKGFAQMSSLERKCRTSSDRQGGEIQFNLRNILTGPMHNALCLALGI